MSYVLMILDTITIPTRTVFSKNSLFGSLVVYQVVKVHGVRAFESKHVRKQVDRPREKAMGKQKTLCHVYFSPLTHVSSTYHIPDSAKCLHGLSLQSLHQSLKIGDVQLPFSAQTSGPTLPKHEQITEEKSSRELGLMSMYFRLLYDL